MNAWPVVCITALAISKLALLMRASDLDAHAGPRLGIGLAPLVVRAADGGEQAVDVGLGIRDAERNAERRALAADVADGRRLRQRKALAEKLVERRLACFRGAFAVDLGACRFGERAPVAALVDRLHGALEQLAMALEKRMRH